MRQYQDLAFRVAYLISGSSADAEDAVQEGFLRAYHALGRFRAEAPFRPWIIQIVANVARTKRAAVARHSLLSLTSVTEQNLVDAAESLENAAIRDERRRELIDAINQLSDADRVVIACRYFLDLTEAETASALGCARGTVKSRLARALVRLRQRMATNPAEQRMRSEGEATHA